ncbi:hypothetical protein LCM10_03220 [Rossellomorea aquimaris]|uniref:hypothetical protein n=1 Tax=Rossellomorea aquimaris TaxID=189382 RepID=UPI001CD31EFD|nr:hypothetical protein [Rossellomorea aquimaris]MCA1053986.1 hypothetical protein [Rossellomorea aquimaris]
MTKKLVYAGIGGISGALLSMWLMGDGFSTSGFIGGITGVIIVLELYLFLKRNTSHLKI